MHSCVLEVFGAIAMLPLYRSLQCVAVVIDTDTSRAPLGLVAALAVARGSSVMSE